MKKKFLSLMMAAAVVATTSVSAFADDKVIDTTPYTATGEKKVVVSEESEGKEAQINIKGDIADNTNNFAPSTISVTVPTAAKFTVDKNGKLVGSNINITSEGTEPVSVIAYKFIDTTPNSNIKVVGENDVTSSEGAGEEKKKVSLKLAGNIGSVVLKTENNNSNTGIYKVQDNGEEVQVPTTDNFVLGNVKADSPLQLQLTGTAVKKGAPLTQAVEDSFTLILKLKKEK